METGTIISLALYFIAMLAIGVYGYYKSTSDLSDYMLGGRRLTPGVTALSAGASDMSGWMLMGLPGAFYLSGFSEVWLALGLTIGAYVNYIIVAPRLRVYTYLAKDSITIPDFFENRFHDKSRILRLVSAIVIIVFFTLYTSAGLVAGGKLFESAFSLNFEQIGLSSYQAGLLITAGVVVVYTLIGGFLAVSMTDFVQGCLMFLALVIVPVAGYLILQDSSLPKESVQLSFDTFNPFIGVSVLGVISLLAWGLGYFGQPHIIVRFMALRSVKDFPKTRRIGMTWMILALIGAMFTGVIGAKYIGVFGTQLVDNNYMLPNGALADAETIFIVLSQVLFHPFVSGFLLAAILAAIMSTISSQLLVTSSALTQDFYKSFLNKNASDKLQVQIGRLSVLLVALVSSTLAWTPKDTILGLVGNAWAGFGAAFGPLVVMSLYWRKMTRQGALAGMITGAVTVLFWIYVPFSFLDGQTLSSLLYEMVPGFIVSGLTIYFVSIKTYQDNPAIQSEFDEMERRIAEES